MTTSERISWREAERAWREADAAFKARCLRGGGHGAEYYQIHRHHLMPPKLDGRLERMVRRIVSNTRLVGAMERHGGVEWLHQDARIARARWQLKDSVRTLLRHVRRPANHPRGGLQGVGGEFRPIVRAYLKGECTDVQFIDSVGWALRLLHEVSNPASPHEMTFRLAGNE